VKKIKVLIVDDSVLIRKVLTEMFDSEPSIEVVGTASDPYIARDKIKQLNPDVVTLDIEMPKMDGITFLKNLMRLRPMPVVMISTLTQQGAPATLEAIELGAVDYVGKPSNHDSKALESYRGMIIEKVIAASKANVRRLEVQSQRRMLSEKQPAPIAKTQRLKMRTDYIIAVGASTGGTEAIREFLATMPSDSPPIVITQHIPPVFSTSFAERMNRMFELTVLEASNGDRLMPGYVYIAPGDKHMALSRSGAGYTCKVYEGEPVNRHMPSVEVLFQSVAQLCQGRAIGVMLTGMGADGATAMVQMKESGCHTLIQDEDSSVVWGMPGSVYKLGGADKVLPLSKIGDAIVAFLQKSTAHSKSQ
jgi:two-component system chemotaxis response regulator CheB